MTRVKWYKLEYDNEKDESERKRKRRLASRIKMRDDGTVSDKEPKTRTGMFLCKEAQSERGGFVTAARPNCSTESRGRDRLRDA